MSAPPAFQFYPDDFIGGTVDLSAEEVGAYIRLLCYQWGRGKAPVSQEAIDRVAGCKVSQEVLAKFPGGKNRRLEEERRKQISYREKQAINGAKGGRPEKPKPNPSLSFGLSQIEPKKSSPSPSPSPSTEHEREQHFPECNGNPTLQEVLSKASMIGLLPWKAEDWFNEMQGCGWLDFHHRPIKDWAAVLTRVKVKWEADGRPSSPPKARISPNGERPKSPMDLKTIIQAKETTAAALRSKFCSDTAIDAIWSDNSKKQEFFNIKREIKQLTAQLSNMA